MPKFYLNLGYKLKKKALCYSHLNNTVDILDQYFGKFLPEN